MYGERFFPVLSAIGLLVLNVVFVSLWSQRAFILFTFSLVYVVNSDMFSFVSITVYFYVRKNRYYLTWTHYIFMREGKSSLSGLGSLNFL